MFGKPVAGVVGLGAVVAALALPAGSAGSVLCPDGSAAINLRGTKICESQPGNSGNAASGQDSSTKTQTQKGSFNSNHPTCKYPPPKGKCS